MKHLKLSSIILSISFIFINCSPSPRMMSNHKKSKLSGFSHHTIKENKSSVDYYIYTPQKYQESPSVPLMLFLHGVGERGDTLDKVKAWGPPKLAAKQNDFPFLLLAPQCPQDSWWTDSTQIQILNKILNKTIQNYKIDTSKIYLTGLSMGGFGTWKLAAEYPDQFSAIAPICGGGDTSWAKKLKDIPTWAFHGERDDTVPVQKTKEMIKALRQKSAQEIHMTLYPEVGHFSWINAYNHSDLFQWLLSKQK